jgi:flagellar biosynthetic protein FliQ
MTPETVLTLGQQTLQTATLLAAPLLLAALGIGLLVSLFQAATQINEMTLSFVPKLLIMVITLLVAGSWMLELLMGFTQQLFNEIPNWIG